MTSPLIKLTSHYRYEVGSVFETTHGSITYQYRVVEYLGPHWSNYLFRVALEEIHETLEIGDCE